MLKKQAKRILLFTVAIGFLALGVVGIFLPFLQGLLFISVALVLFSMLSPRVRAAIEVVTRRYPKVHAAVLKVEEYIKKIVGEV